MTVLPGVKLAPVAVKVEPLFTVPGPESVAPPVGVGQGFDVGLGDGLGVGVAFGLDVGFGLGLEVGFAVGLDPGLGLRRGLGVLPGLPVLAGDGLDDGAGRFPGATILNYFCKGHAWLQQMLTTCVPILSEAGITIDRWISPRLSA